MRDATRAILLANLGSPDSFAVSDVKKYLDEFLMDERVIDLPWFARAALVKGIIVPFRAPKSAAKYKSIWTNDGSPLITISRKVQQLLQQQTNMPVELCMRYAHPTPTAALQKLRDEHPLLTEVVLVPMYPHYAMSSYETAVEHVKRANESFGFELKIVPPFYDHPKYIESLSKSIQPFLNTSFDHVLFSYHGIPERHVRKTDSTGNFCLHQQGCCHTESNAHKTCYRHQIITTTERVASTLGFGREQFSFSFQSRLGKDAWLRPFTVEQLASFPGKGIKKLMIVCPAFVSDCLETLEEIQEEGKEIFLQNGGEEFTLIPCLNDHPAWIATLAQLVTEEVRGYKPEHVPVH